MAQVTSTKIQSFCRRCMNVAQAMLGVNGSGTASRAQLKALVDEWNAAGYSTVIGNGTSDAAIQAATDLQHLTGALVAAFITSATNYDTGTWNGAAGNWTNVAALVGN